MRLKVLRGPRAGEFVPIDDGAGWLPRHVMLREHANGWRLTPLDPSKPVNVNGEPVTAPRLLAVWDTITVGDIELVVAPEEAAAEVDDHPTGPIRAKQSYFETPDDVVRSFEGLKNSTEKIGTLLRFSGDIGAITDAGEMPGKILQTIFSVLPADRGLVLYRKADDPDRFEIVAVRRQPGITDTEPIRASREVVRRVIESREGVIVRDARSDKRFSRTTTLRRQHAISVMCVPLVDRQGTVFGVIHVDAQRTAGAFQPHDLQFLSGLARQAALALDNLKLVEKLADQRMHDQELAIASRIQSELLPAKPPAVAGLELAGTMIPARVVGGDYYDFILHPTDGRLHVCIGDVAGKGLPAGLVMVMARCYLRPILETHPSTRAAVEELNRLLHRDLPAGTFMTLLLMCWEPAENQFRFTGAGHERLLHYRAAEGRVMPVWTGGMALGFAETPPDAYKENVLTMAPGDAVILFTDGLTDAQSEDGEIFSVKGLVENLLLHAAEPAERIKAAILTDLKAFTGRCEQRDDITLVVIKRKA